MSDQAESDAHDLGNLLTIILARSETMLRGNLPEDTHSHVREIRDAIGSAIELVQRARDGKREAGPVDLNLFLRARTRILEGLLKVGIDLELDCDPRVALVTGDACELGRVLVNLVKNAAEAGARRIVVRTRTVCRHDVEYATLTVEDDGGGMSDLARHRLLEGEAFTSKENGSGIGMRSVGQVVAAHGAELRVWSEVGRGTRIEIRFRAL